MKRRYLLYCFTAIIYIVTIISFIDKDKIFSEFENRNLKTNVRFSINKFVNGSFQEEYEEYIKSQYNNEMDYKKDVLQAYETKINAYLYAREKVLK